MTPANGNVIRGDLLKAGHTYASIAAELGVCRQHVRQVAMGNDRSERVKRALIEILGYDPFSQPDEAA
jgi:predicted transcriptional regulator